MRTTIRSVQEFFCTHGRCRELQLADGPHYPVLLSIEQICGDIVPPSRGATGSPGLRVRYRGHREALIALGCISRDGLASAHHGRYANDPRGGILHVQSKTAPGRRGMIELTYFAKSRAFAGLLPGVRAHCADWLAALTARPLLRLVVDNTRRHPLSSPTHSRDPL